jgi:hypothetical protein
MRSVALNPTAKLALSAVLLCAPLVGIVKAQAALAESAAHEAVIALLSLTAPLASPSSRAAESEPELPAELAGPADAPLAASKPASNPKRSSASALPTKPKALFVSAQSVLRLSRSAGQPSGSFVPRSEQHPAGIRLVGVAALGIGVQDGDILVDAMGIPARARGEIIGAIIEARARRVKALSGTLWRAGQTFTITVEQPYTDPA